MLTVAELSEFIRSDFSEAERNELAGLTILLVQAWQRKQK